MQNLNGGTNSCLNVLLVVANQPVILSTAFCVVLWLLHCLFLLSHPFFLYHRYLYHRIIEWLGIVSYFCSY